MRVVLSLNFILARLQHLVQAASTSFVFSGPNRPEVTRISDSESFWARVDELSLKLLSQLEVLKAELPAARS